MEATAYMNAADARPVEVISDFDIPHRLVASGIYELPFGTGRSFANSTHPVVHGILGGWQLAAIYTYQAGAPINFGNIAFIGDINNVKRIIPRVNSGLTRLEAFSRTSALTKT